MFYILFVVCVLGSGLLGLILSNSFDWSVFVGAPLLSVSFFLLSYGGVCLATAFYERIRDTEFEKPSIIIGSVISAVVPILLVILAVLLFISNPRAFIGNDSL